MYKALSVEDKRKTDEEIKLGIDLGDEVVGDYGEKGVVVGIDTYKDEVLLSLLMRNHKVPQLVNASLYKTKTGRHFPQIIEVLGQIQSIIKVGKEDYSMRDDIDFANWEENPKVQQTRANSVYDIPKIEDFYSAINEFSRQVLEEKERMLAEIITKYDFIVGSKELGVKLTEILPKEAKIVYSPFIENPEIILAIKKFDIMDLLQEPYKPESEEE